MIAVEDVIAGLRMRGVDQLLGLLGIDFRGRGELRLSACPGCGYETRGAWGARPVVINEDTGAWVHHGGPAGCHKCRGDILDVIAGWFDIDRRKELPKLLEKAAPIAGITASGIDPELRAQIEASQRELVEKRRREAERRAAAQAKVPEQWAALQRRSRDGEDFLRKRGLDPGELIARDVVRFCAWGDPVGRLFDFTTSEPINLAQRRIGRDKPKVLVLEDCGTGGTLVGRANELDVNGVDVAVIVEGLMDAFAAVLAFPGCMVAGANGTERMEAVARAIVPKVIAARGWLLVCADSDEEGIAVAAAVMRVAVDAGMRFDRDLYAVDTSGHHDLCDAYRDGWRWRWPS